MPTKEALLARLESLNQQNKGQILDWLRNAISFSFNDRERSEVIENFRRLGYDVRQIPRGTIEYHRNYLPKIDTNTADGSARDIISRSLLGILELGCVPPGLTRDRVVDWHQRFDQ